MDLSISPSNLWIGEQVAAVWKNSPDIYLNRQEMMEVNNLLGILKRYAESVRKDTGESILSQAMTFVSDVIDQLGNGLTISLKFHPDGPSSQTVTVRTRGKADKLTNLPYVTILFFAMELDTDLLLNCFDKAIDLNLSA